MDGAEDLVRSLLPLVKAFEEAEEALKSAELAEGDLSVVPINQLRYGFKHLTQALKGYNSGSKTQFEINLDKAEGHCKRAYYDARDVEFSYHIDKIQTFLNSAQGKGIQLSKIIPEYPDWVSTVSEVKQFIETAPAVIPDKDERYTRAVSYINRLRGISNKIPGASDTINQELAVLATLQAELLSKQEEAKAQQISAQESLLVAKKSLTNNRMATWVAALAIVFTGLGVVFSEPLKAMGKGVVGSQSSPAPKVP
jgi:hypothetical protein